MEKEGEKTNREKLLLGPDSRRQSAYVVVLPLDGRYARETWMKIRRRRGGRRR